MSNFKGFSYIDIYCEKQNLVEYILMYYNISLIYEFHQIILGKNSIKNSEKIKN